MSAGVNFCDRTVWAVTRGRWCMQRCGVCFAAACVFMKRLRRVAGLGAEPGGETGREERDSLSSGDRLRDGSLPCELGRWPLYSYTWLLYTYARRVYDMRDGSDMEGCNVPLSTTTQFRALGRPLSTTTQFCAPGRPLSTTAQFCALRRPLIITTQFCAPEGPLSTTTQFCALGRPLSTTPQFCGSGASAKYHYTI